MDTVILWGAGNHSKYLLQQYFFPLKLIEAVIDSDEKKADQLFLGRIIVSPASVLTQKNGTRRFQSNTIIIGSKLHYEDIKRQIIKCGLHQKIVLLDDFLENYPTRADTTSSIWCVNKQLSFLDSELKKAGLILPEHMCNARLLPSRKSAIDNMPKKFDSCRNRCSLR